MPFYPTLNDYRIAVGYSFNTAVLDPNLKGGKVRLNKKGQPLCYAGGYSIVFPIEVGRIDRTFALKCWTRGIGEVQDRYEKIFAYLPKLNLPYFVEFEYVPEGILVAGQLYPIVRMEWVEGKSLCNFIKENLHRPHIFKSVADKFQEMVAVLHLNRISHGDLGDGSVLIQANGQDVEIKLIDYDSLFVPTLGNQPDRIFGLKEYQHPQRIVGGGKSNEKVDYFSELVIYLSFRSLAEKPTLWRQFVPNVDKRLIFSADDFKNPGISRIFRELDKMSPEVKQLALTLKTFCEERSIDNLKPLEDVLHSSTPPHH